MDLVAALVGWLGGSLVGLLGGWLVLKLLGWLGPLVITVVSWLLYLPISEQEQQRWITEVHAGRCPRGHGPLDRRYERGWAWCQECGYRGRAFQARDVAGRRRLAIYFRLTHMRYVLVDQLRDA